jgi:catalytic LigB subunit of aromatic ring-opening dioxygenase
MARIVLGLGTSHTPMLSLPWEYWAEYAAGDRQNQELVFPPDGLALPFDIALHDRVPAAIQGKPRSSEIFRQQSERCTSALDILQNTLTEARPDVTIIVSDDQDEWFFDSNMPAFAVYWGDSAPVIPRTMPDTASEAVKIAMAGYGDVELDVPVAADLGRHIIEYLVDADFDVAHMRYLQEEYGGRVTHRYPSPGGELALPHDTPRRRQGLPHGFSFIVKRLYDNQPGVILPVLQNTFYPPNAVTPRRCFAFGEALAAAVAAWDCDARVALVASGGLSHFVVDEEFDLELLSALRKKDGDALRALPRDRMRSGTSESLNWVTVGAAMGDELAMELIDYVAIYRTEAGTGGGWAFARWQ